MTKSDLVIGIVGPSKSGKSTLKLALEKDGYTVKHIAQEHSFAPSMWQVIAKPDVLIFLDVKFDKTMLRGQPRWVETDYQEEQFRLRHAREHADILIDTNDIQAEQTYRTAIDFLTQA